jgi:hypothetical protein
MMTTVMSLTLMTEVMTTQASTTMMKRNAAFSTICLHLQAVMTMKMVSLLPQISMQQLPTILMSTQDAEMSFTWTPPRRRC